jgi:hypothetical protein
MNVAKRGKSKHRKLVVEAAGVELITMLITRKLLILGPATTAKKAPLPNPLYVYCTKMVFALESPDATQRPQYPTDSPARIEKKHPAFYDAASNRFPISVVHTLALS